MHHGRHHRHGRLRFHRPFPHRQELLVSRLASERLTSLERLLGGAVDSLEARARVHGHAKSNGRGPYLSP